MDQPRVIRHPADAETADILVAADRKAALAAADGQGGEGRCKTIAHRLRTSTETTLPAALAWSSVARTHANATPAHGVARKAAPLVWDAETHCQACITRSAP